ncbi:hypothetical protein [Acuticoccus yangtzensis]|uniref:hypothetical protein n=1 Tax=Acuticoccus yangtzensis TaxID=1443441 RepID=UPI001FEA4631|nr:hypothetical protein [Acuticoccus yangtzensis]
MEGVVALDAPAHHAGDERRDEAVSLDELHEAVGEEHAGEATILDTPSVMRRPLPTRSLPKTHPMAAPPRPPTATR